MAKTALKDKLKKRLEEQKSKRQVGAIYYQKPDTTIRVRILNMGDEEEFIKEVVQFYLGGEIKGVISPSTFAEPCAIAEGYEELKNSDDDDEKELAGKFPPRNKYLAFCLFYKDTAGKEVDDNISPKFLLLTGGEYQEILELYLDEDEWGDMTDPKTGYDLKVSRTGSGKLDTEYSVKPCKNTITPKEYAGTYNLDEEVHKVMPSYEKTQEYLDQFLGLSPEDDEDEKPKTKVKKIIKKRKDLD